jgi:N-methylhydantoinase A/oxoprolinase/acetone carboxylase beta subunit
VIVGLDVGGTNIDAIIISNHQVLHSIKVPMDTNDLSGSILFVLDSLFSLVDLSKISEIHLSTTISTNAIINNELSKVGLIIQSGPGVNIKHSLGNLKYYLIDGYINHQGIIIKHFNSSEIDSAVVDFKQKGIDSVSIITKFSTRNPQVEVDIEKSIKESFEFVTCGHELSDNLNFPRRIFTSYLNAAVYSSFKSFYDSINNSLSMYQIDAPLSILKADTGTMSIDQALKKPVETILSGPAASLMGMMALLSTKEDAICLDIGGTTTDIFFLADGVPLFEAQGALINNHATLVRAISCTSIGLGGDSKVYREDGVLKVGPLKVGKAYAYGRLNPTPTDAMIVLDLLKTTDEKVKEQAELAMDGLAVTPKETSREIANQILITMAQTIKETTDALLKNINSKPVYTIKELLQNKTIKPKVIHLIGAPAKSLASTLETVMGLPVVIPNHYEVANAIGAALAKTTMEMSLVADTYQKVLTIPKLNKQKTISKEYSLKQAKIDITYELMQATSQNKEAIEITQANSFLMVKNGYRVGNNIRVSAQIKPGYLGFLEGDNNE